MTVDISRLVHEQPVDAANYSIADTSFSLAAVYKDHRS